jgi:hypothetical protein
LALVLSAAEQEFPRTGWLVAIVKGNLLILASRTGISASEPSGKLPSLPGFVTATGVGL